MGAVPTARLLLSRAPTPAARHPRAPGKETMPQRTVLIVEDDDPTRERLAEAIAEDEDFRVVAAAGGLKEALESLRRHAPDVVLTDLGLPDGSGLDVIREARRLSADTQTLVISVFGDEESVVAAIEAGARGYLLKDGSSEDVRGAVHQLLAGGSPISPAIARHLLRRFAEPPGASPDPAVPRLSAREVEVLELVVKGFAFGEIGDLLSLSTHTVVTYVRRIYRKLEVRSRAEAAFEAVNLGIVKVGD
jgi:DNA-binding NarL/FixJ family response regulator